MLTAHVLPQAAPARVLAFGAYLKNTACLVDGDTAHWSPLHGDLGDAANCEALDRSVDALLAQAAGPLAAVAHDLHPDYHSTRVALAWAERLGVPAIGVQHHHAHIAVVQAEHGVRGPVIGLALDGVGLGTDGSAWGGELLRVDDAASAQHWQRLAHLGPVALPGGDVAAREPWRMAAAALHAMGRGGEIEQRFGNVVGASAARVVHVMLQRGLNCPVTTSAGRWFDAAAGALRLNVRQAFEAEAAIALEQHARGWLSSHPGFDHPHGSLDLRPILAELFALADAGPEAQAQGAALFHVALAHALAQAAIEAARAHGIHSVLLGGGCFMNRVLTERVTAALEAAGLSVQLPQRLSCGDAGLALGQAWVAACTVNACSREPHPELLALDA
jgi:hydrogenase maturation protein HypF